MGFYGTLKMIFYKVSMNHIEHARRILVSSCSVALIICDAPLTADCAPTAEDEQRRSTPPETPL